MRLLAALSFAVLNPKLPWQRFERRTYATVESVVAASGLVLGATSAIFRAQGRLADVTLV